MSARDQQIKQAMNEASIAIQYDNNKQYPEAIQHYQLATSQIQEIIKTLAPNEPRDPYVQALNNYINRLNTLMKAYPQTFSTPTIVYPPPLPQAPVGNVIPGNIPLGSVVPGAGNTNITVQMATGAVAAASAAYQFNQQYQVTDKVGHAVAVTAHKCKEIDQEYHVVDNAKKATVATCGVVNKGYNKAKEINGEYKVTEKVGQAAKTVYHKAKEIDQKYEIHQKVAHGVEVGAKYTAKGIAIAADAITKALSDQPSQPQQQYQPQYQYPTQPPPADPTYAAIPPQQYYK